MAVVAPSSGHGNTGAALCITAAVGAVAADVEQRRATTQEAAVWPALLPVAEVGRPGATVSNAKFHRRGLHATTQVLLWFPGAHHGGDVKPHRRVKGEEVHLKNTERRIQIFLHTCMIYDTLLLSQQPFCFPAVQITSVVRLLYLQEVVAICGQQKTHHVVIVTEAPSTWRFVEYIPLPHVLQPLPIRGLAPS